MSDHEGSPNQQLDDGYVTTFILCIYIFLILLIYSVLLNSESAAFPSLKCPLEPSTFLKSLRSTGLQAALKEIEEHISSSNQCYHPPQKDIILHGSLDGTTLLLLACGYGDIDCVKHLVENWRVDLQASGVYYHSFPANFWRIESATPLFVASHNGHLNIVKYLVGLGADVSSKTSSEKTPLHGAVQQSHHPESLAIVHFLLESGADPSTLTSTGRPIWMDPSCGVDITTALIQHGLNLNQRNWSDETILHHWAHHPLFGDTTSNRAALAVVELLVNSGADLMARNNSGFTPLLRAASHSRYEVVDFLATRDYTGEAGRMEMIDGMEMAAAKILWESSNGLNSGQERAFEYLRQALDLRQIDALHMTPLKLKRGRTIGWTTAAQLDRVMEQPVEYILQSYLIQLRICSGRSWQAVSSLRDFLYYCINRLKQQNSLDDLIDVLWATLEKIQLHYLDSHYNHQLYIVDDVVQDLIWTLSQLERTDPLNNAETFKTILKVLLLKHDRFGELFCRHSYLVIVIVTFLAGLSSVTLNETSKIPIASGEKALEQVFKQLINRDPVKTRRRLKQKESK